MALITCPECGRTVSDKASACPDCGYPINTVSAPKETNMAEEINKLLVLARRAREGGDSINAKRYYDQILDKDPGSWEAIFYSVYYDAIMCKILHIESSANAVANCIFSTFSAINDLEDEDMKTKAINDVISSSIAIANVFVKGAVNHYVNNSEAHGTHDECANRVLAAYNIFNDIEHSLKKVFPNKLNVLADFQLELVKFLEAQSRWLRKTEVECKRLNEEIAIVYPEYGKKAHLEKELIDIKGKIRNIQEESEKVILESKSAPKKLIIAIYLLSMAISIISSFSYICSLEKSFAWLLIIAIPIGLACFITGVRYIKDFKAKPTKQYAEEQLKSTNEEVKRLEERAEAIKKELVDLL